MDYLRVIYSLSTGNIPDAALIKTCLDTENLTVDILNAGLALQIGDYFGGNFTSNKKSPDQHFRFKNQDADQGFFRPFKSRLS